MLADLDHLTVHASFTEADVVELKVGQSATVTPNAQSSSHYAAKVTAIDPMSTVVSSVVTYGVTLQLTDKPTGVRAGQTVSVQVSVDKADDALYLPASAVRGTGDQGVVTVVRNGVQQAITVGNVLSRIGSTTRKRLHASQAHHSHVLPPSTNGPSA